MSCSRKWDKLDVGLLTNKLCFKGKNCLEKSWSSGQNKNITEDLNRIDNDKNNKTYKNNNTNNYFNMNNYTSYNNNNNDKFVP